MATLAPRAGSASVNLAGSHVNVFPSSAIKPRPVLKRTRDDTSDMEFPSSPSKRSKVTFDSDVEYVSAEDEYEVDPQLIREQVRRAIQRHLAGDDEEVYEKVKQIFSADPKKENAPAPRAVHAHLQAILAHISSLDKSCNGLVNAVLFCEWIGRDESFVKLYINFLGNLAAAKSGFLGKILHTLVDLLGEQRTRRLPGFPIVRQPRIHSRARRAIAYLLNLVPAASSTLAQVIQRKLTMDYRKPQERLLYTKNFLALLEHAQELKGAVLGMITSELVKLDVSVQVDMEDYADELGEEIVQQVSSSQTLVNPTSQISLSKGAGDEARDEEDGGSTTSDSSEDDEDDLDPVEVQRRKVMAHLETVDAVMDLLFEYYHPLELSSSLEVSDDTMNLLTTHFSNLILPTYRSRHAQFLIFHFSQTSPVFVDKYATTCIATLLDHNQPPVLRQTAGSYLAGFVGRGAHVPLPVIKDSFQLLCDELETLRRKLEESCRGPDLRRYASFYSMMQAIMYIFCFRWRDLANHREDDSDDDDDDGVEQYQFPDGIKRNLNLAVNSALNPLRICTPDIVNQFAETCRRLRFLYLFPKVESNKYVRLSNTRRDPADHAMGQVERDLGWVGESGMLEGYFPFDPYRLPRSRKWIVDDYLEWKGLPGDEDDDDNDVTDDEAMDDESHDEGEETATEEDA